MNSIRHITPFRLSEQEKNQILSGKVVKKGDWFLKKKTENGITTFYADSPSETEMYNTVDDLSNREIAKGKVKFT